ncbi:hypothetical protein SNOG_13841 [Parastagonospora nodorum SN15]|uniref:Uncharacterized protein n=1 Tax=Phaeosphaeria nodorum (strain SN15 / ATCC MYA-4574 / FGSC 10173) TaxID=321614 RepID=Q0U323_PHANO|nr:hypothetical protein SNOG_13841 [Parastagonospora nodorum SN15]EAT78865.1 hypothetical protein SNOG_13841 [Parastagonospora nodorum SN15]
MAGPESELLLKTALDHGDDSTSASSCSSFDNESTS